MVSSLCVCLFLLVKEEKVEWALTKERKRHERFNKGQAHKRDIPISNTT